jgi:hypothetical protein
MYTVGTQTIFAQRLSMIDAHLRRSFISSGSSVILIV